MFKRLTIYLILCISVISLSADQISVLSSSASQLNVQFNTAEVQFRPVVLQDGNEYQLMNVPGALQLESGKPNVPSFAQWILVPNGTRPELAVDPGEYTEYTDVILAPVQLPALDKAGAPEPPFVLDAAAYGQDALYPGTFASLEAVKQRRGQDCTIIHFYPYQYNAAQKTLRVYSQMQVSVNFAGVPEGIPANLDSARLRETIMPMAINRHEVLQAQPQLTDPNTRESGVDMIIITHQDFDTAAETLAQWKRCKGINTIVKTTAEIGSTSSQIEDFIDNAYTTWDPAPEYLLFLGDAEFVPTMYVYQHAAGGDQGMVGSDMHYADTNTPSDLIADMSYGRIPIDTAAEADSVVARIIRYETQPPAQASFYNNATCAAYFQDNGYGYAERRFAKTSEDVRNFLLTEGYDVERIYVTEYNNNPTNWNNGSYVFENDISGGPLPNDLLKPGFPWDGDDDDIEAAINAGTYFLLHRDHGYRGGWADPAFSSSDVGYLANGELRPIVWTVNCETGWFDNETDDTICNTQPSSESFTEAWFRHTSGGSVGLLGSTRVSYSGNNDRLVWGFMDAIWPDFLSWCTAVYPPHDPIYRMGDVVNYGKEYMFTNYTYGGSTRRTSLEEFQWFGDPTMEIYTAQPQQLGATHDFEVSLGATEFALSCPLDGAMAALTYNGEFLGAAEVSGGNATISFDMINQLGTLQLTVTGHNCLPYQADITIISDEPYVLCEEVEYIENGNYNDGSIQSLDVIDMNVTLHNIGYAATTGDVTATLACSNSMVTITNATTSTGALGVNGTQAVDAAFSFELQQGIADGTIIPFTVTCTSGGVSWETELSLAVQAPVLQFVTYTLDPSGNDDILNPGESGELNMGFRNVGNGISYNVGMALVCNEPGITITGGGAIPQIMPDALEFTTAPFVVQTQTSVEPGYYYDVNITASDIVASMLMDTLLLPVGFYEFNFELEDSEWDHYALNDFIDEWHRSDQRNITPNGGFSMKCGGTDGSNYSNYVFGAAETPEFQINDNTFIRFSHWMATGNPTAPSSPDGGYLEISVNGSDWEMIYPLGGYPKTCLNLPGSPLAPDTPVFAGNIDWEQVEVDLSGQPAGNAKIRFVFGSAGMVTAEGWYIDDFQVGSTTDASGLTPAVRTTLMQNYPNPFNPTTTISYTLGAGVTHAELEIFNIKGQKVKTFTLSPSSEQQGTVTWNGTDAQGKQVSSGIYFYKLRSDDDDPKLRKMILMK